MGKMSYAQINGTEIDSSQFDYFYTDLNSDGILNIGDSMTFIFNDNIEHSRIGIGLGLPGFISNITGTHYS
jgi:hypothetical protein